ncbi:MAG: hypothetical protein F6K41_07060 [Symploca sp. SIO3E6]|nr:hypothetical protein [Caldora sp. SIO3E6]
MRSRFDDSVDYPVGVKHSGDNFYPIVLHLAIQMLHPSGIYTNAIEIAAIAATYQLWGKV